MNLNIEFIIICLSTIFFMLPAYLSNISGLAFGGTNPLDYEKNFLDNNRLIGDGVTIEGLVHGIIVGTITGAILGLFFPNFLELYSYSFVPIAYTNIFNGILAGFLLGFGALLGDAAGSFLKRRLKIERGRPAPLLDQLDFVVGALFLGSILFSFSVEFILLTCIISIILHLSANIIAYLIGMKDVWY